MKVKMATLRPPWLLEAPLGHSFMGLARIIAKRDFGKVLFWEVHFNIDTIQLMLQQKNLSNFDELQSIHLGSCVSFNGKKCVTRSGEHSIDVMEAQLEVSCVKTLPDKYHGLQQAHRYEDRILDLIMNPDVFGFFRLISDVTYRIREFLQKRGFREFNTGILHEYFEAGLAHPFVTICNANQKQYSLGLTSEVKLKQLIIAGYERVFEIMQSFRNEGISPMHSPEFTLLEVYQQAADYKQMMLLVEEMLAYAIIESYPNLQPLVDDGEDVQVIDFTPPYRRVPFFEACEQLLDLHEADCNLKTLISRFPQTFTDGMHQFTWFFKLVSKYISPCYLNPTFLTEIPSGISPFVKVNSSLPTQSERAILLIKGMEIADVYTDENDLRLAKQEMIKQSGYTGKSYNEYFLQMLELGLPPMAGIGFGLNRFFLTLRGNLPNNIKETILFPLK